ncbi:hypothetical protein OIU77_012565 [Salix suchowensis]|uniref:Uncharacterized protein n=1 Tax=Salix suchowensis TaxID=1278906 RepID=A0ABQ9A457_9ROSI|nr:hypothetical protein OIU77_012565 [Salix suchowensis]
MSPRLLQYSSKGEKHVPQLGLLQEDSAHGLSKINMEKQSQTKLCFKLRSARIYRFLGKRMTEGKQLMGLIITYRYLAPTGSHRSFDGIALFHNSSNPQFSIDCELDSQLES